MLTENNLINWLQFTRLLLDDKECKQKISKFIYKSRNGNYQQTSQKLYKKFFG